MKSTTARLAPSASAFSGSPWAGADRVAAPRHAPAGGPTVRGEDRPALARGRRIELDDGTLRRVAFSPGGAALGAEGDHCMRLVPRARGGASVDQKGTAVLSTLLPSIRTASCSPQAARAGQLGCGTQSPGGPSRCSRGAGRGRPRPLKRPPRSLRGDPPGRQAARVARDEPRPPDVSHEGRTSKGPPSLVQRSCGKAVKVVRRREESWKPQVRSGHVRRHFSP